MARVLYVGVVKKLAKEGGSTGFSDVQKGKHLVAMSPVFPVKQGCCIAGSKFGKAVVRLHSGNIAYFWLSVIRLLSKQ